MQVTPAVLNVLDLGLRINGDKVVIHEKLDRKLYVAVNKVLEACGGKWSRKEKAHVFGSDPTDLLAAVVDSGEVMTARDVGFFETPVELAAELVDMARVRPGDTCLEPSAGTGRIVEALAKCRPASIDMVELDQARAQRLAEVLLPAWAEQYAGTRFTVLQHDFALVTAHALWACAPVDLVVMNPPFCKVGAGNHLDHVQHAFEMLKPGGLLVSVLPISVQSRTDKRHTAFRAWYEGLDGKIRNLSPAAFAESGTHVRTCVLRVQKRAEGHV